MNDKPASQRRILYHLLMGLGFLVLIGWFYLMRELGFMRWIASLGPASHAGAMNMLAIMLWMLPALLLWKYYIRLLNRKFKIGGIFYEDYYYTHPDQKPDAKRQSPDHHQPPKE